MSDFLQMNLNRMSGIRDKTGQIADRRTAINEAKKNKLFDAFKSGGQAIVTGLENTKSRQMEDYMADKKAGIDSLAAGQERQHQLMRDYNQAQMRADEAKTGFGYDKQLQYIRNEGAGPGKQDYDLYSVANRAIDDLYGNIQGLFVDGKFQGWGAVDKVQLENTFMDNLDLSGVNDSDKEIALKYFKNFLTDIENEDITKEEIDKAIATEGGLFSKIISGIKGIGQGSSEGRAIDYSSEQLASSIEEVQGVQPKSDPVAWNTMQSLLGRLSGNVSPEDAQIANYYLNEAKDGKLEPYLMDKFIALLNKIAPQEKEVPTRLNAYGGL